MQYINSFAPDPIRYYTEQDYRKIRQRRFLKRFMNWLRGTPQGLMDYETVKKQLELHTSHDTGIQLVSIDRIIGSTNRRCDYDRQFTPLKSDTKPRWIRVDNAVYSGAPLPPVELIQIGCAYFVSDGHHRISVARFHGWQHIEARVITHELNEAQLQKLAGLL